MVQLRREPLGHEFSTKVFGESVSGRMGFSGVLDGRLRPFANQLFARPARSIRLDPTHLTMLGLAVGLMAAAFASQRWWLAALVAFAANRLLDGLDGAISRQQGSGSDRGAYLDIVADTTVFVVLPLGIGIGHDRSHVWLATAVLLGSFAVNLISWSHLSALLERRHAGASTTGELTTVTMPKGLVEGTESMAWFVLFLVAPQQIVWWMLSMAVAVVVGVIVRVSRGMTQLDEMAGHRRVENVGADA